MSTVHTDARCGDANLENSHKSMITVRMPRRLHLALMKAAHDRQISLNAFCVEQLALVAAPEPEITHA